MELLVKCSLPTRLHFFYDGCICLKQLFLLILRRNELSKKNGVNCKVLIYNFLRTEQLKFQRLESHMLNNY